MTTYKIKFGDNSVALRATLPDQYGNVTSGSIQVITRQGTTLDSGAITVPTATTLSAAADAGDSSITVASVTGYEVGDTIKIAGVQGAERRKIRGIDSGNKIFHLDRWLDFAHATAAAVDSRMLTYDLDASGATFTAGLGVTIRWGEDTDAVPDFDTDDPIFVETGEIAKSVAAIAGLEVRFRSLYPRYAEMIHEGSWGNYQSLVWNRLAAGFKTRGRDIAHIVDLDQFEPLFFAELALFLGRSGDSTLNDEVVRLERDRDNLYTVFAGTAMWEDSDQDGAEEDSEKQTAARALPFRRW